MSEWSRKPWLSESLLLNHTNLIDASDIKNNIFSAPEHYSVVNSRVNFSFRNATPNEILNPFNEINSNATEPGNIPSPYIY